MLSYGVHELGAVQEKYGLLSLLGISVLVCLKLLEVRLTQHKEMLIDLFLF
jgi:hypothetical protein